jgi:hypothetical protein
VTFFVVSRSLTVSKNVSFIFWSPVDLALGLVGGGAKDLVTGVIGRRI